MIIAVPNNTHPSTPAATNQPSCIRSYLAVEAFAQSALIGLLAQGHDPNVGRTYELAVFAAEYLHDELAKRYRELRQVK